MDGRFRGLIKLNYPGIFLEGMSKTTKNLGIAGMLAEIQTKLCLNTRLEHYCDTVWLINANLIFFTWFVSLQYIN